MAADTEYLSLEQDEAGVTVLVRMVRPWNEWLITWGYDINEPPPNLDDEMATSIVHSLIGDDSVPVTIRSLSLWGNNKMYAERYREGRVFAVGDAVHRHPPSNRLGSNTSIQHSHNLAWKLAYVLQGKAGEVLRDSFDPERAPVGKQIVLRANKSIEEFGAILDALGLPGRPGRRGDAAQHGIPRRRHRRGCGPPHCWLGREGRKVSTHDVVGKGRFAVLTGITGRGPTPHAQPLTSSGRPSKPSSSGRGASTPTSTTTGLGSAKWQRTDAYSSDPTRRARRLALRRDDGGPGGAARTGALADPYPLTT